MLAASASPIARATCGARSKNEASIGGALARTAGCRLAHSAKSNPFIVNPAVG